MLIPILLIIIHNLNSFSLACFSNDDCLRQSMTNPTYCHPIAQNCTDCIFNGDCQSPNSYCTFKGSCIQSISCSSDRECNSLSPDSICVDRVCSREEKNPLHFSNFSQKGSKIRDLSETTTLASIRLSTIDFRAYSIVMSRDEKTLYTADQINKFAFYDLENPLSPKLIIDFVTECQSPIYLILSDDEKFLYAASISGLCILDIQDLSSLKVVQKSELDANRIGKFKNKPFISLGSSTGKLTILDATDPQNPSIVSEIQLDAIITDILAIKDDTAILTITEESLYAIDITNTAALSILYQNSTYFGAYLAIFEEENLALICSQEMFALDIADLNHIYQIGYYFNYFPIGNSPKIDKEMKLAYVPGTSYGVVLIDISDPSNMKQIGRMITRNAQSFATNSNFTTFYVADNSELILFQTEEFSSSPSNDILGLSTIDVNADVYPYSCLLSPDETLLYVCAEFSFNVYDLTSIDNIPILLKQFDYSKGCLTVKFTPDYNYLVVSAYPHGIVIYDLADPRNPVSVSTILPMDSRAFIDFSADGNILVSSEVDVSSIKFFNISVKNEPSLLRNYDTRHKNVKAFKKYPDLLFVLEHPMVVLYNISDLQNLRKISEIELSLPYSLELSPNENYAFVADSKFGTRILDVSNVTNISLVQTLPGANSWGIYYKPSTNYLWVIDYEYDNGVYVFDVSDPQNAISLGIISSKEVWSIQVSNKNIAYVGDFSEGLKILKLKSKYALKTSTNSSLLGISTDIKIDVGVFREKRYIPYNSVYKIIDMSLYKMEIDMITGNYKQIFSPLTSWMKSDFGKGIIKFSPENQQHLGRYNVFIRMSTIVEQDSFSAIQNITDVQEFFSSQLIGKYLDGEGYLNLNFDPLVKLVLDPKYNKVELDIRNVLAQSYVQSTVEVDVLTSLLVKNSTSAGYLSLTFETPTLSTVTVRLTFVNKNVTFMEIAYETSALLRFISSGVVVSGSKFDTNIALELLRVDLSGTTTESDGQIIVNDGMNPVLTNDFFNMTAFFRINQSPYENILLQSQLDKMEILTGNQFNFIMNPFTFIDPDYDVLSYSLTTIDGKSLPGWVNLVGNTLVGTPPDELNLKVTLKIIASDGYKKAESIFTIRVKPSPAFILSLIGQYIGPVIGAIGLWIYAIVIYNILFQKVYTFPKSFLIRPKVEVNNNLIFPISLYGFELDEATKILYEMKKSFKRKKEQDAGSQQETKKTSNPGKTKNNENYKLDIEDIINYLTKLDGTIDADKLENLVEETVKNSPMIKLFRYKHSNFPHQRLLILDIIKDKLNLMLIENNKPTFKVFKAISGRNWGELCRAVQNSNKIEDNLDFSLELNEEVFKKRLRELGFQPIIDNELDRDLENLTDTNPPIKRRTVIRFSQKIMPQSLVNIIAKIKDFKSLDISTINIPLLKESLLAFFKARYNVAVPFTTINFKCFIAENKTGFIARVKKFLKLNLTELAFNNKNFVGFGMKYKILNDTVFFYGKPYREFEGNTIAFQILSKNGKILREIKIRGIGDGKDEAEILIGSTDKVMEGNSSRLKARELKLKIENSYRPVKMNFDLSSDDRANPEANIDQVLEEIKKED